MGRTCILRGYMDLYIAGLYGPVYCGAIRPCILQGYTDLYIAGLYGPVYCGAIRTCILQDYTDLYIAGLYGPVYCRTIQTCILRAIRTWSESVTLYPWLVGERELFSLSRLILK